MASKSASRPSADWTAETATRSVWRSTASASRSSGIVRTSQPAEHWKQQRGEVALGPRYDVLTLVDATQACGWLRLDAGRFSVMVTGG